MPPRLNTLKRLLGQQAPSHSAAFGAIPQLGKAMFTLDDDIITVEGDVQDRGCRHVQAMNSVLLALEESRRGKAKRAYRSFRGDHSVKGAAGLRMPR